MEKKTVSRVTQLVFKIESEILLKVELPFKMSWRSVPGPGQVLFLHALFLFLLSDFHSFLRKGHSYIVSFRELRI